MSDPFWDRLDDALPRARRGAPGWAHQRAKVLTAVRAPAPALRGRVAGLLAAGVAAAALAFVLRRTPPPPAAAPLMTEEIEFLDSAPMLENLDELLDAPELDPS